VLDGFHGNHDVAGAARQRYSSAIEVVAMELDFLREIIVENAIDADTPGEVGTNIAPQLATAAADINQDATPNVTR
jgi:hypothetical protein